MYVVLKEEWKGVAMYGVVDVIGVFDSEHEAELFADTMNRVRGVEQKYLFTVRSLSAIPQD